MGTASSSANVMFAKVRQVIDERFLAAATKLEDAYYGDPVAARPELRQRFSVRGKRFANGWRQGVSHPVTIAGKTFDACETPALSKSLFDKLHGLIWLLHERALIEENERQGFPYREGELSPVTDGKLARSYILAELIAAIDIKLEV